MSEVTTWDRLVEAHRRVSPVARAAAPHEPTAAVLACSDARVPPSVVFDQPAGSLFVVRIAGNSASPAAMASLDYAVSELGVDLLIVLGHTACGAVAAAADGTCDGHLAPVVEPICGVVARFPEASPDELVRQNVINTIDQLAAHPGPTGVALRSGRLEVRGAVHDISVGELIAVPRADPTQPQSPLPVQPPSNTRKPSQRT